MMSDVLVLRSLGEVGMMLLLMCIWMNATVIETREIKTIIIKREKGKTKVYGLEKPGNKKKVDSTTLNIDVDLDDELVIVNVEAEQKKQVPE